jgi:hypothetical protein
MRRADVRFAAAGLAACLAAAAAWPAAALAQGEAAASIGDRATLTRVTGEVSVRGPGRDWADAATGQTVGVGDEIHTGFDSQATLTFKAGEIMVIRELTDVLVGTLLTAEARSQVRVLLKVGEVTATIKPAAVQSADFSIKSPTATASVRGTEFKRISYYPPRGMETELLSGKALVSARRGRCETGAGEKAKVDEQGRLKTPRDIQAEGPRVQAEPVGLTAPEREQIQVTNQPQPTPASRTPSSSTNSTSNGGQLIFRYVLQ